MPWLLRVAAWSTAFAVPCWALSPIYQIGLLEVVNAILAPLYGPGVRLSRLGVAAPWDIGLFVALCLATREAPQRLRRRAVGLGIPMMVALELAVVIAGLTIQMLARGRGGLEVAADRLDFYLLHTIPWLAAPLTWAVLLGGRALPFGRVEHARSTNRWPGRNPGGGEP